MRESIKTLTLQNLKHAQAQRQYAVSGSAVLLADESHVPEKHIRHAHDDACGYFNLHGDFIRTPYHFGAQMRKQSL